MQLSQQSICPAHTKLLVLYQQCIQLGMVVYTYHGQHQGSRSKRIRKSKVLLILVRFDVINYLYNVFQFAFFSFPSLSMLEIKSRDLHMPSKCSTTELMAPTSQCWYQRCSNTPSFSDFKYAFWGASSTPFFNLLNNYINMLTLRKFTLIVCAYFALCAGQFYINQTKARII